MTFRLMWKFKRKWQNESPSTGTTVLVTDFQTDAAVVVDFVLLPLKPETKSHSMHWLLACAILLSLLQSAALYWTSKTDS